MKILHSNKKKFKEIYGKVKNEGKRNLHILADFDRTLTYYSVDGEKILSIISLLRNGNYLSEDYSKKAHELFSKYHPIEIDPKIPLKEKKKAMIKWWNSHSKLRAKSGFNISDLKDIVENGNLKFRKGVLKFLDYLHDNNIPLVIIPASSVGDAIPMLFEKHKKNYSNIFYIINKSKWDNKGNFKKIIDPIIHSLNKDETVLKNFPEICSKVKDKKNVILLGDGIGDIKMITGFDYNNLIKIGFLNFDEEKFRKIYLENFDIILEGDGDFNFINKLINEIK